MGRWLRRLFGLARSGPPADGVPPGRWSPRAELRAEMSRAVAESNAAELARTGADAPAIPPRDADRR